MSTPIPSSPELLVNTTTNGSRYQPTITALADGCFVVAWADDSGFPDDSSTAAVRAQVFHADGSKGGGEFLVNTTTTGEQYQPTITAVADGPFVVAWTDDSCSPDDSSTAAVRAQVFNADGST